LSGREYERRSVPPSASRTVIRMVDIGIAQLPFKLKYRVSVEFIIVVEY